MPDTSHPHANYEELFNKTFALGKRNLFTKPINDETKNRFCELYTKRDAEAKKERDAILDQYSGKFDIHTDSSAIELFKELETALGKGIVQQISTIGKRCIFIIGKDSSLIKGVASYAYYIHTKNILKNNGAYKSFYYFGCLGLGENKIDDWLEQETLDKYPSIIDLPYEEYKEARTTPKESAIEKYKSGSTLFMRGLESEKVFKKLAGIVQDEKSGGLLIVSAVSKENVPGEFLELCETINLDPEKQGTPRNVIPFPTPTDTQWHEVGISFIDTENVMISVKGKTAQKHYFDMGFRKGKSRKPVASWFVLKVFSEKDCLNYAETGKTKTEKSIQDLRKRLIAYFGIHGDPITLKEGYRPVFKCCTNERRSRSVKAFSNSEVLNDDNKDDD